MYVSIIIKWHKFKINFSLCYASFICLPILFEIPRCVTVYGYKFSTQTTFMKINAKLFRSRVQLMISGRVVSVALLVRILGRQIRTVQMTLCGIFYARNIDLVIPGKYVLVRYFHFLALFVQILYETETNLRGGKKNEKHSILFVLIGSPTLNVFWGWTISF